jgi:hypothetical protein
MFISAKTFSLNSFSLCKKIYSPNFINYRFKKLSRFLVFHLHWCPLLRDGSCRRPALYIRRWHHRMHKGKTNLAFYYSQPAPREFNLCAVGMRPAAYSLSLARSTEIRINAGVNTRCCYYHKKPCDKIKDCALCVGTETKSGPQMPRADVKN